MKRNIMVNERMHRMPLSFQDYDYTMYYKAGKDHDDADAMSRLAEALEARMRGVDAPCPCEDCRKERGEKAGASQADPTSITVVNSEESVRILPLDIDEDTRPSAATVEYDTSQLVEVIRERAQEHEFLKPFVRAAEPMDIHILAISGAGYQPDAIRAAQQADPSVKAYVDYLSTKTLPSHRRKANRIKRDAEILFLEDNIVYRKGRPSGKQLFVPEKLKSELLLHFHTQPYAGHLGMYRTYGALSRNYFWPGMRQDILNYIRTCEKSAVRNHYPHERVRVRQQVDVPHICERVSIGFQGPFTPSEQGNTHVLNFMCLNTGWVEGIPIKASQQDAKTVAQILVNHVILK